MEKHVALLRAINVGGNNKLPMPALARIFTDLGATDVVTYIQSGNVVYVPPPATDGFAGLVSAAILAQHGLKVPVVLRTGSELVAAVAANPFPDVDLAELHLMVLADVPAPERVAGLDPDRSPPARFRIVGRDMYLHLPKGVANTKITNVWVDKQLATVSTVRNWRTVQKLVELTRG